MRALLPATGRHPRAVTVSLRRKQPGTYRNYCSAMNIDAGARQRLTLRFGGGVAAWLDGLPAALVALADRWHLDIGQRIPRGSVSVVFACRRADGTPAILKASPDRARL